MEDDIIPPQSTGLVAGSITHLITTLPSELQLRQQSHGQANIGDLPGGQHQQLSSDSVLLERALALPVTTNLNPTSATLNLHPTLCDPNNQQKQPNVGSLSTATTAEPTASASTATTHDNSSYREVMSGLNSLWVDQKTQIETITDDHWKNLEFPLARIKKIMRMDDDVKMISTEVPVMFSKILEIFITELTMRSWLHTEESKRRTVQRSDIAMAITKHDMFDFLIDIVPREEIQFKSKTQKDGGDSLMVSPDMLQSYTMQLLNQMGMGTASGAGGGGGGGEEGGDEDTANTGTLQQLQLLHQLMQLQKAQQDQPEQQQQQQQQLQQQPQQQPHQPTLQQQQQQPALQSSLLNQVSTMTSQNPSGMSLERQHQLQGIHRSESAVLPGIGGGVDVRVLQSSMGAPSMQLGSSATNSTTTAASSSMGTTLEQIAKNGGQCHLNSSDSNLQQIPILYPTQSLPIGSSEAFGFPDPPPPQQQQSAMPTYPSSGENSHITTVVISQPPDSLMQMSQQPQSISSTVLESSTASSSSSTANLHHHPQAAGHEALRNQLESLATEQFITQQLPIELASKFGPGGVEADSEDGRGIDVVDQGSVSFQHIS